MFIGSFLVPNYFKLNQRLIFSGTLAAAAAAIFGLFLLLYNQQLHSTFTALAHNQGKHPPDLAFVLFSLSGALGVLGFTLLIGDKGAKWLAPFTLIGKDTLGAFIFHLTVLFIFYRLFFDLWLQVSYPEALGLAALLIILTAIWIQLKLWRKKHEGTQIPPKRIGHSRHLKPRELSAN
jgi:fucose 4-O-acetylase-like acetyltransferase